MSCEDAQQRTANVDQDGEVANGNMSFNTDSDDALIKEARPGKKVKRRTTSKSSDEGDSAGGVTPSSTASKLDKLLKKNSRKSRNGFGRGLPKKGGAGGKGTWGAPGSEIDVDPNTADQDDPNYESESEGYKLEVVQPILTEEEMKAAVKPILLEYLEHGETEEVLDLLDELNIKPENKPAVLGLAVSIAMERHDPYRELTSRLISDLYGNFLTIDEMQKGFDDLLENLADLSLDTPDAPTVMGRFIARAVADDCLPPKYVHSYKGKLECKHAQNALAKAELLLGISHGIVRLDNVWGVGGGNRPVRYLMNRINLLLKEYMSSDDIQEATRCLRELDVPHFHHEFVYEALLVSIEDTSEHATGQIVTLLKSLATANIISPDQMSKGTCRIFEDMPEICLDVPAAYTVLEDLGIKMYAEEILSEDLHKKLPTSRGRKRFVSEGDGGRLKDSTFH